MVLEACAAKPRDGAEIERLSAEIDNALGRTAAESGLTQDELAGLFAIKRDDA